MRDRGLYARLLGIEARWRVEGNYNRTPNNYFLVTTTTCPLSH